MVNFIVAACEGWGIGKGGSLPWRLNKEMKYFAKMTTETKDPSKKVCTVLWNGRLVSAARKLTRWYSYYRTP